MAKRHRARPKKRRRTVGAAPRRTRSRRRRVGGVNSATMNKLKQGVMFLGGAGAGVLLATFARQGIQSAFPTLPAWAAGAIEAAAALGMVAFLEQNPLVMGVEAGLGGMGIGFAANDSFISLPGISGMPSGLPGATPGFFSHSVNGYKGIPRNMIGNFSGGGAHTVNGLYNN